MRTPAGLCRRVFFSACSTWLYRGKLAVVTAEKPDAAALLEEAEELLRRAGFDDSYGTERRKLSAEDAARLAEAERIVNEAAREKELLQEEAMLRGGGKRDEQRSAEVLEIHPAGGYNHIDIITVSDGVPGASNTLNISMGPKGVSAGKKTRQGKRNTQRSITKKSEEESRMQMRSILQRRRPGSALNRSRPFVSMFLSRSSREMEESNAFIAIMI